MGSSIDPSRNQRSPGLHAASVGDALMVVFCTLAKLDGNDAEHEEGMLGIKREGLPLWHGLLEGKGRMLCTRGQGRTPSSPTPRGAVDEGQRVRVQRPHREATFLRGSHRNPDGDVGGRPQRSPVRPEEGAGDRPAGYTAPAFHRTGEGNADRPGSGAGSAALRGGGCQPHQRHAKEGRGE